MHAKYNSLSKRPGPSPKGPAEKFSVDHRDRPKTRPLCSTRTHPDTGHGSFIPDTHSHVKPPWLETPTTTQTRKPQTGLVNDERGPLRRVSSAFPNEQAATKAFYL